MTNNQEHTKINNSLLLLIRQSNPITKPHSSLVSSPLSRRINVGIAERNTKDIHKEKVHALLCSRFDKIQIALVIETNT
ncbi:hypothetical protein N0Y54_30130 [Nostoc punctiforme UO1]|uniref:hypothetical protein n=1 Tax=Nostoc punctiforme TaxID=272131 RepID=UPI0030B72794